MSRALVPYNSPQACASRIDAHFDVLDAEIARVIKMAKADGIIRDPRSRTRASDGLSVIDCTGVTTGNADLDGTSTWAPPQGEPEEAPLPIYPETPEPSRAIGWLTERRTERICAVLWFVSLGFAVFGGVK